LTASSVYVCPLRHGTGLKNKVLEAMAMGLAVVCYSPALDGMSCQAGRHAIVASTPAEFATAVVRLLRTPEETRSLAKEAHEFVAANYSWELRAQAFERLYEEARRERQDAASAPRRDMLRHHHGRLP